MSWSSKPEDDRKGSASGDAGAVFVWKLHSRWRSLLGGTATAGGGGLAMSTAVALWGDWATALVLLAVTVAPSSVLVLFVVRWTFLERRHAEHNRHVEHRREQELRIVLAIEDRRLQAAVIEKMADASCDLGGALQALVGGSAAPLHHDSDGPRP